MCDSHACDTHKSDNELKLPCTDTLKLPVSSFVEFKLDGPYHLMHLKVITVHALLATDHSLFSSCDLLNAFALNTPSCKLTRE